MNAPGNKRTIWKFEAEVAERIDLRLPTGAEIIHIGDSPQTPGARLAFWALVEPAPDWETNEAEQGRFTFLVRGTGHPVESGLTAEQHVATVIAAGGALVWHVFAA